MSYVTKDRNGRSRAIISDIKSFPGKNISQERWEEIFGKKESRPYFKSRSYYKGDDKYEEEEWYEEVSGLNAKINVIYKNNIPISYKENGIEKDFEDCCIPMVLK